MTQDFEASLQVLRGFYTNITAAVNKIKGALSRRVSATATTAAAAPMKEGRLDLGGNPGVQVLENPSSSKQDIRFRQTTLYSDADASEASFVDMLRITKKPAPTEADASTTGAAKSVDTNSGSDGRSSKKKGRQIDRSLLGFKLHSNRIMGEIHHPDN